MKLYKEIKPFLDASSGVFLPWEWIDREDSE